MVNNYAYTANAVTIQKRKKSAMQGKRKVTKLLPLCQGKGHHSKAEEPLTEIHPKIEIKYIQPAKGGKTTIRHRKAFE